MEEDSEEITISYETLFELLVRERSRGELQKLPDSFFDDVLNYLKQKKNLVKEKQGQSDFALESSKITKEIENMKQIVKDLYNKREKKIVNLALDKSRTQSSIVDTNLLLKEEKELFDELVNSLDRKRKLLEDRLTYEGNEDAPLEKPKEEAKVESKSGEVEERGGEEDEASKEGTDEVSEQQSTESSLVSEAASKEDSSEDSSTKLVRFVHAVPKFLGLESEEYGPFEEEDVASLPREIALLLLKKERVEEIKES